MTFSAKLTGGNIKTGQAAKQAFESELKLSTVTGKFVRVLQANTPVKTGRLRGNWKVIGGAWGGNVLQVRAENQTPYAARVNQIGRSAGYADRGIAAGKAALLSELKVNINHVVKQLWDKAGTK